MALVQSREPKVHKMKWSHSCQPRWLSVSHDTLVQVGNYLSQSRHIWQGDTPKISAHVIRIAEWDHPSISSWADSPLGIRDGETFIKKTQKSSPGWCDSVG